MPEPEDQWFESLTSSQGNLPKPKSHYAVLPETLIIAALALTDLIITVALIGSGRAREGNGWMSDILLDYGPFAFTITKALFTGLPLALAEMARKHNERFVRNALRVACVAYLLLYTMSLATQLLR